MRKLTLLLAVAVASGCYRYVPISTRAPEIGTRVSVSLTDAGTAELARFVGPGVSTIEGHVVSANQEAMNIAVSLVRLHSGLENFWKGELVAVPHSRIAGLRERRLSRTRSLLSAGTLLLAAVAAVDAFTGPGRGASRGGGGRPGPR
jgi:hypothetical protein